MEKFTESHGRSRARAKVSDAFRDPEPMREEVRSSVTAHGRTRKRRSNSDRFYVPQEVIPDGWTYQWCRASVMGQPDTAHQVALMENGWTPVPADRHGGLFMPKGHEGSIERDGLILMERPNELTAEARYEEKQMADQLIRMQKEQLSGQLPYGFDDRHRGVRPVVRSSYEQGPSATGHQIAID